MERNFKKEIQEAASNPIDMAEMMAQLVQVLKRDKHDKATWARGILEFMYPLKQ